MEESANILESVFGCHRFVRARVKDEHRSTVQGRTFKRGFRNQASCMKTCMVVHRLGGRLDFYCTDVRKTAW